MNIILWIKSLFGPAPLPPEPIVPLPKSESPVKPVSNPDQPLAVHARPMVRADELSLSQIDKKYKKGTAQWYQAAYLIIQFDNGSTPIIAKAVQRVLKGKANYVDIENRVGIPWYVIALIHNLECNCDFRGVLHNGELIVGTGRKTKLVPKNRGPFKTWREAALDAIETQAMWAQSKWDVGSVLKVCEAFNGLGYLKYHPLENSPYIWANSTINDGFGKYVADGKWSPSAATDQQVGAATLLRQLEIMGEVEIKWA